MKKLLFFIFITTFFYACPGPLENDPRCNRVWFEFSIPVDFSPSDSVLNIGDTITITSRFPNKLWDVDSSDQFVFDSIDFHTFCGINKIDTINRTKIEYSTFKMFDILIDEARYNYKKANITFSFDYEYFNDEYFVQFKLIPKYKGVYFFSFGSKTTHWLDFVELQEIYSEISGCVTEHWYCSLITNRGIGNNKEFLKLSPGKEFNSTIYEAWNAQNTISGVHLFKVE
jgi:hypothetical protein